jgi:hypothetical protein
MAEQPFDPLRANAEGWQSWVNDHQAPDRLDADQRPDNAVVELPPERGRIVDTRRDDPDETVGSTRADILRGIEPGRSDR